MQYFYIDETYKENAEYWHCNIGGAIIPPSVVVDLEIELSQKIHKYTTENSSYDHNKEFKYTDFFSEFDDVKKINICDELVRTFEKYEINFLISHAKCKKSELSKIKKSFGGSQQCIQKLAFFNLQYFLAPYTNTQVVQTIVDLGLCKGFKPVYEMYVAQMKGLIATKLAGFKDKDITSPNFRNLPSPLFIRSRDSRIVQFCDLIIGSFLSYELGQLSDFKSKIHSSLAALDQMIRLETVEWNKNA